MPRIRCHYTDCVFVDDGYCGAAAVELDPDSGCATYTPNEEAVATKGEDWEEEELEEWEEEETDEEEDDNWEEDEDDI